VVQRTESLPVVGKHYFRRKTCRLCNSAKVDLVLQLTATPPVDAFVSKERLNQPQDVYPLDLFLCQDCGHAQLLDVVDPKLLFGDYIYTTSGSPGLVEHFRKYADEVFEFAKPKPNSLVVEIGSNDGTLLNFFKHKNLKVLGIDPAREIAEEATQKGLTTLPKFFSNQVAKNVREQHGPAAIVCANNVFAHSDELADMANGVKTLLAPDGIFVFEVSYMLDMIEHMIFDFIYHEHLCHHSVKPLKTFLSAHGMELIDVVRIPTKGGSIRVFAQLSGGPRKISPAVEQLIAFEEKFGLYDLNRYKKYSDDILSVKNQIIQLIGKLRGEGKTFAAYGASATTTVLTYHFNLGNVLEFIVDDNETRQGLYSPGFHIPVVSSKAIYEKKPDYLILLAWRFADMMMEKHKAYLKNGGRFIVPLPELRTV